MSYYSDQEKQNASEMLMQTLMITNSLEDIYKDLETLKFEDLSRSNWADIQKTFPAVQMLINVTRESVKETTKLMDNDALMAHINATITARED